MYNLRAPELQLHQSIAWQERNFKDDLAKGMLHRNVSSSHAGLLD
jgi:hypothetical protein